MSIVVPEIVSESFENGWLAGIPAEHYHKDKTAISSGGVREALKSGRKFFHYWHKPYSDEKKTDAMYLGSAAHVAILEPLEFDKRFIQMPNFGAMQSSTNRAKRDAWILEQPKGAIILKEEEIEKLKRIIDSLLRNTVAVNLIKGAAFEQTAYARDPITGLKMRIRPDVIRLDLSALPDLKTTGRDASADRFSKEIWEYKYHVQLAFYEYTVELIHGRKPDMPCFIVCETTGDFDVCVFEADIAMMERGRTAMHKGLARIAEGVVSGNWYGYQAQAETISLPRYTDYIED